MIKFDPHLFFNPRRKKIFTPHLVSQPPPKEKFRPPPPFGQFKHCVYDPLFSPEKPLFQKKNSFTIPISILCSCFRAHATTLLLKILGAMHGQSPTSNFGGTVPLGLRPWVL